MQLPQDPGINPCVSSYYFFKKSNILCQIDSMFKWCWLSELLFNCSTEISKSNFPLTELDIKQKAMHAEEKNKEASWQERTNECTFWMWNSSPSEKKEKN